MFFVFFFWGGMGGWVWVDGIWGLQTAPEDCNGSETLLSFAGGD